MRAGVRERAGDRRDAQGGKECKGETQLRTLADKLKAEGIAHWLWMEQPENLPTRSPSSRTRR